MQVYESDIQPTAYNDTHFKSLVRLCARTEESSHGENYKNIKGPSSKGCKNSFLWITFLKLYIIANMGGKGL